MSATFYRLMNGDRSPFRDCAWVRDCAWSLPQGNRPGRWMPKVAGPYWYCRNLDDVLYWATGDLYEVEVRGVKTEHDCEGIAEQVRLVRRVPAWNEDTLRLFIADCRALSLRYAGTPGKAQRTAEKAARWHVKGWRDALYVVRSVAVAAGYATGGRGAYRATTATVAEQVALLGRYLAGEPGPLV